MTAFIDDDEITIDKNDLDSGCYVVISSSVDDNEEYMRVIVEEYYPSYSVIIQQCNGDKFNANGLLSVYAAERTIGSTSKMTAQNARLLAKLLIKAADVMDKHDAEKQADDR